MECQYAIDDFVNRRDTDAKTRVLERFAQWVEPVGEIIAATPAEDIVERPLCDRVPLQYWSKGRVTLLGDAAHPVVPSLGQGANMAFEDAYKLAECLDRASNPAAAFAAYEQSRIPRTTTIYDRSADVGRRAARPDSETIFKEMMKPAQMERDDFDAWLYSYQP